MNSNVAKATTAILRQGNPWLVSHNVQRVAPLFLLHALLREYALPRAAARIEAIIKVLSGSDPSDLRAIPTPIEGADGIPTAIRGTIAADRRVFGSTRGSAFLPVHRGLLNDTGSDDGLGRRVGQLIARSSSAECFRARVKDLFNEQEVSSFHVEDPVTRFARLLTGGITPPDELPSTHAGHSRSLGPHNEGLAEFVVNAFRTGKLNQRISSLRSLALAGYLVSIVQMLQGPLVERLGEPIPVIVYAGLPPGSSREPAVMAAIASLRAACQASWSATIQLSESKIFRDGVAVDSSGDPLSLVRQRLVKVIGDEKVSGSREMLAAFEALRHSHSRNFSLVDFIEEILGAGSEILVQRIRSLGWKVGSAAPDRRTGGVRLTMDTPLLAVIVDGLVPEPSIDFALFVTRLREKLGLVAGLGSDDSFVPSLRLAGYRGPAIFDVLVENEEILRQRLIRAGLARTYSDAHTEVISSDG